MRHQGKDLPAALGAGQEGIWPAKNKLLLSIENERLHCSLVYCIQILPMETVADFKSRIALLMRNAETGKRYSMVGASRAHPCVLRKPKQPKKGK